MKSLTATEVAPIIPEPAEENALEILGDVYQKLDDSTADAMAESLRVTRDAKGGTVDELRDRLAPA